LKKLGFLTNLYYIALMVAYTLNPA